MRADEIRGLSDAEVESRIAELERERFNLRFKSGTQVLEDPLRLRVVRKDLARLKTIQRQRALDATAASAPTGRTAGATTRGAATKRRATRTTAKKQATARSRRDGR